jgi:F-type H+-transporting ATPase subunit epsilon
MNLKLITLLGEKINEQVYQATIPTVSGDITVYPGHEPLVTVARPGAIAIRFDKADPDSKLEYFAISGGIVEISSSEVKILVDAADHSDDIVEADTKAALERAIEMQKNATDQVEREKAHEIINRQQVRLKVAELRRRKRR